MLWLSETRHARLSPMEAISCWCSQSFPVGLRVCSWNSPEGCSTKTWWDEKFTEILRTWLYYGKFSLQNFWCGSRQQKQNEWSFYSTEGKTDEWGEKTQTHNGHPGQTHDPGHSHQHSAALKPKHWMLQRNKLNERKGEMEDEEGFQKIHVTQMQGVYVLKHWMKTYNVWN